VIGEYHWITFPRLHKQLEATGYNPALGPSVRRSFWGIVPPGRYSSIDGQSLLATYRRRVEEELANLIAAHSIGYWLYVYRRVRSKPSGEGADKASEVLTRRTLEAAFRKFGQIAPCEHLSADVPVESVLDGGVGPHEKQLLKEAIAARPGFVLAGFGVDELRALYEAEVLAFEVWRCGAALRVLAKGAGLIVSPESWAFRDTRTEELNRLLLSLDERAFSPMRASSAAVVFQNPLMTSGTLLSPSYNLEQTTIGLWSRFFAATTPHHVDHDEATMFIWTPVDLNGYLKAHDPFAEAFQKKHGIRLEAVVVVLGALLFFCYMWWRDPRRGLVAIFQHWRHGYHGPILRSELMAILAQGVPATIEVFVPSAHVTLEEVPAVLSFLEVNDAKRGDIDILLGGPRSVLVPYGDHVFLDVAWVDLLLYELLYGLSIPDQNFKALLLEELVRRGQSVLQSTQLKAADDSRRQIDGAFRVGRNLVIVECKAVGRSLGVDRGDRQAVSYRVNLVDRALREADDKASWLSAHPKGANYDVTSYDNVVGVAVTPFVEFIPSLEPRYWLTPNLPRVLTPDELWQAIDSDALASDRLFNLSMIQA
jgi:hypothetical protein